MGSEMGSGSQAGLIENHLTDSLKMQTSSHHLRISRSSTPGASYDQAGWANTRGDDCHLLIR